MQGGGKMPTIRKTTAEISNDNTWVNASTYFENGDGTRYLFHFMPARHGGIIVKKISDFYAVNTMNTQKKQHFN